MPTLSFILSGLLVGAGAIYMYLSSTEKIEKTKAKIIESKKIEYLTKKTTLKLSSATNSDVNKSMSIVSLDDSRISDLVALDEKITPSDIKLLNRLQKAVEHIVLNNENENPTCSELASTGYISESECKSIKNKKFNFYKTTSEKIELPKDSLLANDTIQSSRITQKMITAKSSERLVKKELIHYKKEVKNDKKLEKIISKTKDSDFIVKVASKYLKNDKKNRFHERIKKVIERKTKQLKDSKLTKIFDQFSKQEDRYTKYITLRLISLKKRENYLKTQKKTLSIEIENIQRKIATLEQKINNDKKREREEEKSKRDGWMSMSNMMDFGHSFGISSGMDSMKNMKTNMEVTRLKSDLNFKKIKLKEIQRELERTQKEIDVLSKRGHHV